MKGRKFKVDKKLRDTFLKLENNEFSILELRDKFEAIHGLGEFANSSELRKWIYRCLASLTKRKYVTKQGSKDNAPAIYHLSERFYLEFGNSDQDCNFSSSSDLTIEPFETDSFSALKLRLNQYKVDMLSCAGECKEYQQLAADYPHLKDLIQPMFRDARERSSELIGQLRAINNLMKQSGSSE